MKKILTVSLIAIMAVSAARADIASVKYVDDSIRPVSEAVETKAAAAELQALDGRVTSAETNITNMGTTISNMDTAYKAADEALGGRLTTVETTYATKAEIEDLDVGALEGRVEANETAITALQGADTALDGRVTANEGAIADINNATTGIAAVAAQNLANAKDELEGKIDLKADTTTVNEALAEKAATSEVTTLAGRVEANETAITALPNNYQAKAGEGLSIAQNGGWAVPIMPEACKATDVECALVAVAGGAPKWQIIR